MPIMLPSGINIRIREDLIDGAARVQTTLIIDPIIANGHRVTMADIGDLAFGKINQGNSKEELMSWTGITDNTTTYTLTGCVWGINFYNLSAVVANRKRHTSGDRFSINTDMHFMANQYRALSDNVFTDTDPLELETNEIKLGDGTDALDKIITNHNGDANEPFVKYDESSDKWLMSNDGINTFDPEQGGSGLVAGHGIDIVAGAIDVDLTELTTDTALDTTGGQLSVVSDEDTLIRKGASGLYNDVVSIPAIAQTAGYLTGGTNLGSVQTFATLGAGTNDGKFKINVDGTVYDNVAVNLSTIKYNYLAIDQTTETNITTFYGARWNCQSFTTTSLYYLNKVTFKLQRTGNPTGNVVVNIYLSDGADKPTGSSLATASVAASTISNSYGGALVEFATAVQLLATTKYCIVITCTGGDSSNYIDMWRSTGSEYADGKISTTVDSGINWTNQAYDAIFKVYLSSAITDVTPLIQTGLRAATGSTETVIYSTDHFVINSVTTNRNSQILKLMAPTTGTDIGVAGYLDLGANATETLGTGDENRLVKTDSIGKVDASILKAGSTIPNLMGLTKKIFFDYTSHTFNNSGAENTYFTTTVAGGSLNTTGYIRGRIFFSLLNDNSGADTVYKLYYGTTVICSLTINHGNPGITFGNFDFCIAASGATNSQTGYFTYQFVDSYWVTNTVTGTATEDSTADKTLKFTVDFESAGADGTSLFGYAELVN